ncbi:MAG TPA: OmpA family protein [Brumimicrobium sp.]|nr:OmpA family protein [Brumimicrobium sp.]
MKFKNRNRFIYPFFSVLLAFSIAAQEGENLVNNPSFENAQNSRIRRIGDIERADGWTSATGARADLFSAEAKAPEAMTPENVYGTESPQDGINYAGIVAYSYRESQNRSYLQTQLTTPLKKGMRYKVQFYVSLSELSRYSTNKIGAYFSRRPVGSDDRVPAIITDETHVEHPRSQVFNALYGWDLVCGEYVASGNERFLTIGNFTNETGLKTERVRKPREVRGQQIPAAYYYVDDVSVQLLGPDQECDCAYGDEAEIETLTVYQRSPEVTPEMSPKDKLTEYNIYYAKGRYDVRVDGQQILNAVVNLLNENPNMKIEITGHSDEEEAQSANNKAVSIRRAEYIRTLLADKEIDENRIYVNDAKSSTPSRHITDLDEENLKNAKNRRISFKAL